MLGVVCYCAALVVCVLGVAGLCLFFGGVWWLSACLRW